MNFKSLHHRLFLYLSISLGALLCLLACLAFLYASNSISEDAIYANEELTNSAGASLDNLLLEINKLSLYASTNPTVRESMTALYHNDTIISIDLTYSYAMSEILTSISVPNSASSYRISIFNDTNFHETTGIPTSLSFTNSFLFSDDFYEWYNNIPIISNNESIVFETYDPWTNTSVEYVTLYREIFSSTATSYSVGVVMVQCPYDDILELISFDDPYIESYIFDTENNLLITNTQTSDDTFLYSLSNTELQELVSGGSHFSYGNTYSSVTLSNGWQLLIVQTQNVFASTLLPMIVYLICGTLFFILLTFLILYIITKRTTKPLQQLITQVEDVSLSNLSINTDETSFDEFELLNNAFSDMFIRLRSSMDENEKRKTYELQANLIALQSQMDPHFLYNMLAVIKSMNREKNHEQVDYCCNYLARMLRYIATYDENSVTLSRELEHAELYLNLMKFRYEDQFNFYINVDTSMNTDVLHINKLILQPLLENCFQHGLKNVLPVWNIMVNCYTLKNSWYISVTDNGGGISEEDIQRITNTVNAFVENPSDSISQLTLGGMGLVNTLSRLKLNHKDDISYNITHNYPTGTIITIQGVLPNEYISN